MRLTVYSPTEFPVDLLFNLLGSMLLMAAGGFLLFKSPVKIQILNGVFNLVYSEVSILHELWKEDKTSLKKSFSFEKETA